MGTVAFTAPVVAIILGYQGNKASSKQSDARIADWPFVKDVLLGGQLPTQGNNGRKRVTWLSLEGPSSQTPTACSFIGKQWKTVYAKDQEFTFLLVFKEV